QVALLDIPVVERSWRALDPNQRRLRTLDALKCLILRECQRQPVAVAFEDLHWATAKHRHSSVSWSIALHPRHFHWFSPTAPSMSILGPEELLHTAALKHAVSGDDRGNAARYPRQRHESDGLKAALLRAGQSPVARRRRTHAG